jgi:hypothetical protein
MRAAPVLFASAAREEAESLDRRIKASLLASLDFLSKQGWHPAEIRRKGRLRAFSVELSDVEPGKYLVVVFRELTPEELHTQRRRGADTGYIVHHIGIVNDLRLVDQALALAEARLNLDPPTRLR